MILLRKTPRGKILSAARLVLFTSCLAGLTQCGRDQAGPAATTTGGASKSAASPSLTPDLEAAAVRIIVTIASTVQKDYGGVLLHREALIPAISPDSLHRMAAVFVPDFNEKDLQDKACVIRVRRNKIDDQGGRYSTMVKGILVHFDDQTHLAVVVWAEKFPASMDVGLMPAKDRSSLFALKIRTDGNIPAEPPFLSASPQRPPPPIVPPQMAGRYPQTPPQRSSRPSPVTYAFLENSLYPAKLEGTKLVIPGPDVAPGGTVAVLGADGGLAGFGRMTKDDGWDFHPFAVVKVEDPAAFVIPQIVTFERGGESRIHCRLDGEWHDPLGEMTRRVVIQHLESPDGFVPAAHPEKSQPPLAHIDETHTNQPGNKFFSFPIHLPNKSGTLHDLVQVQLLSWDESVRFSSAPILVSVDTRGGNVYPEIRGLAIPTGGPADVDHRFKDLTAESRILYGVPIREGREVLFKLEGAPFWKRLSLEKSEWLPLPKEDLSTAVLAGNKDAIFLAQPATRQIRRYNTVTLAEEKSALLPEDITCRDIVTGCLGSHAPVAIICQTGVLACDPHDLTCSVRTIANGPGGSMNPENARFIASGDGGALKTFVMDRRRYTGNDATYVYKYRGQLFGVGAAEYNSHVGSAMTVSAPYIFTGQTKSSVQFPVPGDGKREVTPGPFNDHSSYNAGEVGTFANSPVCFRVIHGDWAKIPSVPEQCSLQCYFSPEPFLTFGVTEGPDIPTGEMKFLSDRVWFDPFSMSVAIWHGNRTVSVRIFDKSKIPVPDFPVLLNFPETIVPRGGQFQFAPVIFGPPGSRLEVTNPPTGWQTDAQGIMKWQVPHELLPGECTLQMKLISGKADARPEEFTVTLKLDGVPPAAAVPAQMDVLTAEEAIRKMAFGAKPEAPIIPLPTRFFKSDRPIGAVLPGLNHYLLLLQSNAVALFSLKEWKIAGSLQLSQTTFVYPAQDCLLSYDSASRAVSRLRLPDFSVASRLALPGKAKLMALGVGEAPDSPVALILDTSEDPRTSVSNAAGRTPLSTHSLMLLDKETLTASKWAPFTPQKTASAGAPREEAPEADILTFLNYQTPVRVPVSRDGRILFLPGGEILMSPTLTTDHRTAGAFMARTSSSEAPLRVESRAANTLCSDGQIAIGSRSLTTVTFDPQATMNRSASCVSVVANKQNASFGVIESMEGRRPLLNLMNLEMLKVSERGDSNTSRQMSVLGDQGLLVLLNKGGTLMQVISFDLPKIFKEASPASVLVTSRAPLFVTQGQKFEYQVAVNNPEAVRGYRIRDNVAGASIDDQGHFIYAAPPEIHEDKQVNIGIEVVLKNDEVVLHEFPICVVPFQLPK